MPSDDELDLAEASASTFPKRAAAIRRRMYEAIEDVTYIYNYGKSHVSDLSAASEAVKANLQGMQRALDAHYNNFNVCWSQLGEMHDLENKTSEFPTVEDKQKKSELKKHYFTVSGLMELVKASNAARDKPSDPNITVSEVRGGRSLPKINLPTFDGQLLNWLKFRDTFISLVHNDRQMSVMEKYHYLRTSLKGPALSAIACLKLDDANYAVAWKSITDTFDNKRLLASAYLDQILNFKPLQGKATPEALNQFLSSVTDHVSAFKMLNVTQEAQFILFHLSIRCLDPVSRELFEMTHSNPDTFPTFDQLSQFVRERSLALQLASNKNPMSPNTTQSTDSSHQSLVKTTKPPKPKTPKTTLMVSKAVGGRNEHASKSSSGGSSTCIVCRGENHHLLSCQTFHQASPIEKLSMLKDWRGCLNCLSPMHKTSDCSSKWHCRFCPERHHSSLHKSSTTVSCVATSLEVEASPSLASNSPSPKDNENVILGTAIAHILDARGQFQEVRLVIDSGSQNSFLTQRCLNRLGLKLSKGTRKISGIGQTIYEGVKGTAVCIIKSKCQSSSQLVTEAIVVPSITSYLPTSIVPKSVVSRFKDFELADPSFWKPGPIDLLLGADLFTDIWTGIVKEIGKEGPKLLSSIFGFIVMGKIGQYDNTATSLLTLESCDNLSFQLERFWQLEEPTLSQQVVDPDDIRTEKHFVETHYRLGNGRYGVRLPFRDPGHKVGDSTSVALQRFFNLERKLKNNASFCKKYHEFLKEYEALNHMSPANSLAKFVIPHHGITKDVPEGLKLKVVFDASVQVKGGSLNSHLLTGPKLQNDIRDILLRFRHHKVAFTTDIVKMFRMIEIHPEDRCFMQMFWRFNPEERVELYELNTVIYGLVCAPFLAQRVLRQLSSDHGSEFTEAARVLQSDSYVDDILTGAPTVAEALVLQDQLIQLLNCGQFQLSKWNSSSADLLKNAPAQSELVDLSSPNEQWVKILGLQWEPQSDKFSFSIGQPSPNQTKRGILSTVARLYDPLGFLAPTTLLMKSFIQELWTLGIDWDESLPQNLEDSWTALTAELPLLSEVQVPRPIGMSADAVSFQLVGFSDASSKGYAAVLYLIISTPSERGISLLTSKSKLAPTKTKSIPRLELSGALLLAELYSAVLPSVSTLPLTAKAAAFFTDSTIVLAWVNTSPHNLKTFVANRVAKIQELSEVSSWQHVRSEENPSDAASRGILPSQLLKHDLWWSGPPWLTLDQEKWPKSSANPPDEVPEFKTEAPSLTAANRTGPLIVWISRFSSYTTLIKAAGWIRRWIYNCMHMGCCCCRMHTGSLHRSEFDEGYLMCIKAVQDHHFHDVRQTEKKYADLKPFRDEKGIWHVGGRLRHSSVPESRKYPILLPHDSHFSSILVDHYHKLYLHPGPNTLQAVIQTKFWIPSLRRLIRYRGFRCLKCYKSKANVEAPLMGDLPRYRVNGGRTFQHVGVDFAGPFPLKESHRRKAALGKVYLCLFVCISTKALHLEAVTRLTTEAFLASFQRFTSRRGIPTDVYSDCGSNFLGAASYLKELYRWFASQETKQDLLDYAMSTKISWHFNPPQTPHMGGLWESGVKSVKRHLRLIAGDTPLTFEEISTWFARIEAILNSRPLCPLSTSPEEIDYLSQGHFLVGGPLLVAPEPSVLNLKDNLLSRWQLVSKMSESFWGRWRTEYLSTLQRRSKWRRSKDNLQVGDLVLLKDNSPPLQWKLGKVIEVHPGDDEIVRVVLIRVGNSVLRRHALQLVPLRHLSFNPSE